MNQMILATKAVMKLPNKKGEQTTVWEGFEDGAEGPSRILLISDGSGRWSMQTESAWLCDIGEENAEEWSDGEYYCWDAPPSVSINSIMQTWRNLRLAMREYSAFCLRPEVVPEVPSISADDKNIVAKMKGNRCLVVENHGSSYNGEMILSIYTNESLGPGEWIVALENLVKALDAHKVSY